MTSPATPVCPSLPALPVGIPSRSEGKLTCRPFSLPRLPSLAASSLAVSCTTPKNLLSFPYEYTSPKTLSVCPHVTIFPVILFYCPDLLCLLSNLLPTAKEAGVTSGASGMEKRATFVLVVAGCPRTGGWGTHSNVFGCFAFKSGSSVLLWGMRDGEEWPEHLEMKNYASWFYRGLFPFKKKKSSLR